MQPLKISQALNSYFNSTLKIVADENIIYAKEAFSAMGEVELYPGREITPSVVRDAGALLVRSITDVNKDLLKESSVRFVGTATIGSDHIDLPYLNSKNISFADAKGCNSDAVAEYLFNALLNIAHENNFRLQDKSIGIIGYGNIGTRVARLAEVLNMKVLINDPPLQRKSAQDKFVSLKEILEADIITLHVPLTTEGKDKTFHLLGLNEIALLKKDSILINASRGAVIDNGALNQILDQERMTVVLDVWEDEPDINTELVKKVKYATPHIAGYSVEGKINGTIMIYNALRDFLQMNDLPDFEVDAAVPSCALIEINNNNHLEDELYMALLHSYDIRNDDNAFRKIIDIKNPGKYFDDQRKNYPLRRELTNYTISLKPHDEITAYLFRSFRFIVSPV